MTQLDHRLQKTLFIAASRATVFRYFTDSERFAVWWGSGSTIDAVPGGQVHIVYPNGVVAGGEVLEVEPDERIAFTFGYASGQPVALGSTRVEVRLADEGAGTRLDLVHDFADAAARDAHVAGWAYQLSVFANVVAREAHADAGERLDRFFALWTEADASALTAKCAELLDEGFAYRDAHACLANRGEFVAHVVAVQKFFPGAIVERAGEPRQCQGSALVDWRVTGADGQPMATGTNAVRFDGAGRLTEVVSFWNA